MAEENGAQPEAQEQKAPAESGTASTVTKKKKITRMSLDEIEKALKKVSEKMGGLDSHYAQDLIKRRDVLKKG